MKKFIFGFALFISGVIAFAQDQVVDAKDEPHHRPKLVNDVVRVIDVEVLPSDATLYHKHSLDYPYVMLSTSRLKNDVPGKAQTDLNIVAGLIGYYRASQGAYTHRFTNVDNHTFRAIGIELLNSQAAGSGAAPLGQVYGLTKVLDNERVRAYRITLLPDESIGPLTLPGRSVRVAQTAGALEQRINNGDAQKMSLSVAEFEWRDAATSYTLKNVGDSPLELVEFEFK